MPVRLDEEAVFRSLDGARVIGIGRDGWGAPCPPEEPVDLEPPFPPWPPGPPAPPGPAGPTEPPEPPPALRTSNRDFIVRVYRDLLGRAPEPAGLEHWLRRLDWALPRAEMVRQVLRSEEAAGRFVDETYRSLLARAPDEAGRRGAVLAILDGAGRLEVERRVLVSPEFAAPAGSDASRCIDRVYRAVVQRPLDPTGDATWPRLLSGGSPRAAVVEAIQRSSEARELCVARAYQRFVGTAPPPELVRALAPVDGGATFRVEDVVIGVLTSPGYDELR